MARSAEAVPREDTVAEIRLALVTFKRKQKGEHVFNEDDALGWTVSEQLTQLGIVHAATIIRMFTTDRGGSYPRSAGLTTYTSRCSLLAIAVAKDRWLASSPLKPE